MKSKNNLLIDTIASLSGWEINNFRKWLSSPVHNSKPRLLDLFDFCLQSIQKGVELNKERAFSVVFTDVAFEDKKWRHAMYWLMEQLRMFLIWQEISADKHQMTIYTARSFRKRNIESGFLQTQSAYAKGIKQEATLSSYTDFTDFQLKFESYQWNIVLKRVQNIQFESLLTPITAFYTTRVLQLGCMHLAQQAINKQKKETLPELEMVLESIGKQPERLPPLSTLYYYGYQMLARPEEEDWPIKFRNLFEKYGNSFATEEARDLLMMAINNCIRHINQGQQRYLEEIITFYELGLKRLLLHDEQGYLSKYTYNNVLLTFIARKDWEKGEIFLETYREQLPSGERAGVYAYNKALFLFRKGEYSPAQEILISLSFPDVMYNLEARRMLLRIYFEENANDALVSLIDNMQTWLRRHGEIGYHREMYRNLARFTSKLLKIPPYEKTRLKALITKIETTPLVADRSWLLEKVREVAGF